MSLPAPSAVVTGRVVACVLVVRHAATPPAAKETGVSGAFLGSFSETEGGDPSVAASRLPQDDGGAVIVSERRSACPYAVILSERSE